MDFNLKEKAIKAYLKNSEPPKKTGLCIDGLDTSLSIIKDESAYRTINSIITHKTKVKQSLEFLASKILDRANTHDDSKLRSPEIDYLIAMDKEPFYKYGSPEYFDKMKRWDKFFLHHYSLNSHHPDHFRMQGFSNGLDGMNLVDLIEFLADIISYCDKLRPQKAFEIIEAQAQRFELSPQLVNILKNTLTEFFTWVGDCGPEFSKFKSKFGATLQIPNQFNSSKTSTSNSQESGSQFSLKV